MGIAVIGKEIISLCGELSPGRIRSAFDKAGFCRNAGSSRWRWKSCRRVRPICVPAVRTAASSISSTSLNAYVTGDIGCYTLGFMPPLNAMDTCVCMGASISNASGIVKVAAAGGAAAGGGGDR